MAAETLLALWNDTPTRRAIVDFVQAVSTEGSQVTQWLATAAHPVLRRPYLACGFAPMVELLRYLEANDFSTYIASGGDRDFMRPFAHRIYGIPPERVIVLHDDADREFAYTTGAEDALDRAKTHGWTVVSMKEDWSAVFARA